MHALKTSFNIYILYLLCLFHSFEPPFWSKQITAVLVLNLSTSYFGDLQTLQTPSHIDTLQSLKQCIICRTPTKAKVKGWQQDTDVKAELEKELRTGNQRERSLSVWRLWGAVCRLNLLPIFGKKKKVSILILWQLSHTWLTDSPKQAVPQIALKEMELLKMSLLWASNSQSD